MAGTIGAVLEQTPELKGVVFDVITTRRTSRSQRATSHKIERGKKISDSVIQENIVVSFRAEIGNVSFDGTAAGVKARESYDKLVVIYDSKEFFDYQTGFELFDSMIFTSLDVVEEVAKSGALIFDATLEQLDITSSEQVAIPQNRVAPGKTRTQLSSKINRGRQEPQPLDPEPRVIS